MGRFVPVTIAVLLTGCASAPQRDYWPLVPKDNIAGQPFAPSLPSGQEMATLTTQLAALRNAVAVLSHSAGAHDWSAGDGATAGGLMAVIGQAADKLGLRNTGLGLATLSVSARERYQFDKQRTAYLKTSSDLTCLQQVVSQLSDRQRLIALGSGQAAEVKAAASAPLRAAQAIEFARAKLEVALGAVSAEPPDRAALADFAKRYAQGAEAAASSPAPKGATANSRALRISSGGAAEDVPEWEVQEALNKVKSFEGDLQACRHE